MTLKIHGETENRVRGLLDGQEPTPAKVDELFDELAQLRASAADAPPAPDAKREEELARQLAVMAQTMRMMEEKITDLSKPRDAATEDQAIMAGKLPPAGAPAAPPLGLNGFNSIPRGVWIKTPIGGEKFRNIDFKICGCDQCSHQRLVHYFCSVCHSGPHDMRQNYPRFSKMVPAPGSVWGINHFCCTEQCRQQYLSMIGVAPGINDHEPQVYSTVEAAQAAQQRPAVSIDSD